jgi:Mg2+ and Co2+ transporter CorA
MKDTEKMTLTLSERQIRIRSWADRVLSDRFMTELAFLLIPTIVIPLVINLSAVSILIFDVINKAIVILFVVEYVLKLVSAESRSKYIIDPWRILDLLIILLATIDFIPSLPINGWRASPILRLLRLARVLSAAGRTMTGVVSHKARGIPQENKYDLQYHIFMENRDIHNASLEEVKRALAEERNVWIDVEGIDPSQLSTLSKCFGLDEDILKSKLFGNSFPSFDKINEKSIITYWNNKCPDISHIFSKDEGKPPRVLIICTDTYLASLSESPNDFDEHVARQNIPFLHESFSMRALYSILKMRIEEDADILQAYGQKFVEFEEKSGQLRPPKFLEETFQLKKVLQQEGYKLRHFFQMMKNIHKSKAMLPEISDESRSHFGNLLNETEALHDYCQNIQEDMKSLIELQVNRVSFNLNRVMRFLAVISCMALIPTIIGGLLGQNLLGQPFNISLGEIFFFVFFGMSIALYIFYRIGWLK